MTKKRVLSGVQPTGAIHIGNWLGAIRNWVSLQNEYDTYVCVVDLHAITVPHDPQQLKENTLRTAALYVACGMDPKKCSIFVQSHISAHSELCWLLNCVTPLNWMERMIQFKEKAIKQGDNVSIGLLDYPVLMAADILLYDADLVPVGEDQKQHLELARDIAQQRVNSRFNKESKSILKIPKPLIMKEGGKIMSLIDGNMKMSKSDPNENSRIALLDSPEIIKKKIKRAKTDSFLGLEFDNNQRPEANNLLGIYSMVSNQNREAVQKEFSNIGWGKFKPILTDAIIESLNPIQQKYYSLIKDKTELNNILNKGYIKANTISNQTLKRVRNALGFLDKPIS
ncbi:MULTISPECIES: tryptophan--tRNA ligase [Prochlorococcus]|uniref:Tryptophan--tRNA ligase n=1 Tax=Prochlorococcus marinus (strain SARG / CCMP1375 / SS120) TaxID=167539 RepID=SYW_PROMA|nr:MULTISPECIES: tryptophan--tRNA ligase [Prochlorococcus]Q7VBM9.1 RecName: Full=Tryptophan--tRNA ligase; AltName: Full=Tryptophanyl-tRNA synthetase; Short=TrpRS [Prochlorococcus marinus subsp. marinus str. CCMP1375]AAQ00108.1 Tryptophanyl-tRNA synthetase [Prochlorococcus marinus subsp. marinus str. CCMP1375]KGG13904.1 Tryptophanyl-tRNA synthetase [Prochlorococcus marinus str. LG]KGG19037.1 Tryptophanyl-tRNA synthetase [Prochlorococcus marinus str. SS2]KGG23423.1 Tryptophanyl-tRNA synthetase [